MTHSNAYVEQLQSQLDIAEDRVESLTGEKIRLSREVVNLTQQRDNLLRQIATVVEQRDDLAGAVAEPVHELLGRHNRLQRDFEEAARTVDRYRFERDDEVEKNRSLKQVNEQLRADLETTRVQLRESKESVIEAQEKVLQLAVGLEPDTPILRDRSARTRAIEAADNAERSMEVSEYKEVAGWSQVAQTWASVAMIPERRDSK